jgi:hypothetical protein
MCADHGRLLRNTIKWALNEDPIVEVKGPGVLDITAWRQQNSMAVHLVNLTNPMMMKGPFRELIPVSAQVKIKIPPDVTPVNVKLLVSGKEINVKSEKEYISLTIPEITDHEIVGVDF